MPMLPFSRRTTASVCVFSCMFVASPMQGAPLLVVGNGIIGGALALEYAQLVVLYQSLRQQDIANQETVLNSLINQAVTQVAALRATLATITVTGMSALILAGFRIVVANALTNLKAAQAA
jgi:hypothetical protein